MNKTLTISTTILLTALLLTGCESEKTPAEQAAGRESTVSGQTARKVPTATPEVKETPAVAGPDFSTSGSELITRTLDGKHVASRVRTAKAEFLVVDGKPREGYKTLGSAAFSPDGTQVAVTGQLGKRWLVAVDEKEIKSYPDAEHLFGLAFSPDGKRLAYGVKTGSQSMVVLDGKEGKAYANIDEDSIRFSPDGGKLSYSARTDKGLVVVINETEGKPYEQVGGVVYSPDGKRVGYTAILTSGTQQSK